MDLESPAVEPLQPASVARCGAPTTAPGLFIPAVAVLFARRDSIYKTFPECDVYDVDRDARTWAGGCPVVAHPPCRSWSRMRAFARPQPGESDLALYAVEMVRRWGGVLEHPAGSALWKFIGAARPGCPDRWGGWRLGIHQHDFGHRAEKATYLYIVGCAPGSLPPLPLRPGRPSHVVASSVRKAHPAFRSHCTHAEREHTPPLLASWLVTVAQLSPSRPARAAA